MRKALGIILAGGSSQRLGELTETRATPAMPVGGSYRAIDFTLSNMANTGISKVAIITQYNSRSLLDHLSSAKWWDLGRKQGGLFIFTPYLSGDNSFWYRGTADSIYQNITFLKRSNEKYVIIASGDQVYRMDYEAIMEYHEQQNADITIVGRDLKGKDVSSYGVMQLDENMTMTDFEEKPLEPQGTIINLGIYVIQRTLLIKLLETIAQQERYDIVKDIIIRYRKKLKIKGYMFDGYWNTINSLESYYNTNMDFLKRDIRDLFINKYPYIETKPKDEPPAKYNIGARVKDTLIGSGGILNGTVEHSVLFRKVYTGENSVIKDSVIMEGCYIGNNCIIENAILDKEVVISDGKQIIGTKEQLVVIKKGTVI
jgi:glucose-1-phosphate adenylyltransferase